MKRKIAQISFAAALVAAPVAHAQDMQKMGLLAKNDGSDQTVSFIEQRNGETLWELSLRCKQANAMGKQGLKTWLETRAEDLFNGSANSPEESRALQVAFSERMPQRVSRALAICS